MNPECCTEHFTGKGNRHTAALVPEALLLYEILLVT